MVFLRAGTAVVVSVVIPAINEQPRIGSAVRRAWEAGADEVIVSDGGSCDQTASIARSSECRLVVSSAGRGTQCNAGARVARGDYLVFLHADTWLVAGAISQLRGGCSGGHPIWGGFRQRIENPARIYRLIERGNEIRLLRRRLCYGDQALFVQRRAFEQVGGYAELLLMEDVALSDRLKRMAPPVLLPGPLHVDARRWQRHGPIRQTIRNWVLFCLFRRGISPHRLANYYPRHDRDQKGVRLH